MCAGLRGKIGMGTHLDQGLTRLQSLAGSCSHLEAKMGKHALSRLFKLLAELISLWLYDGGV